VIGNEREEPDMKKTVSILLAAALLLSCLAGCGNGGGGGKSDAATISPEATGVIMSIGIGIELGNMEKDAVVTDIEDKSNKGSITIPDSDPSGDRNLGGRLQGAAL